MAFGLVQWLQTLPPHTVADVLKARPDAVRPVPRSLPELADRLTSVAAVGSVLEELDQGCHDVLASLCTLGDGCSHAELEHFHGISTREDRAEFGHVLERLGVRALVWPTPESTLRIAPPLQRLDAPLNLGRPVRPLLDPLTSRDLSTIAVNLGLEPGKRKSDTLEKITAFFSDEEAIRDALSRAPAGARTLATDTAWSGPECSPFTGSLNFGGGTSQPPSLKWLADRAFLTHRKGGPYRLWEMPREVAWALRGPDYRAPFRSRPPQPRTSTVDSDLIDRPASAAAGRFVDGVARLLEHCSVTALSQLRSGGIGQRAIKQLTKSLQATEPEIRLWLETSAQAELLDVSDDDHTLVPSAAGRSWLREQPAQRLVPLLLAWWQLPGSPTNSEMEDKSRPALKGVAEPFDRFLRHDLLRTLAEWQPGASVLEASKLDELVAWQRPVIHADARTIAEPAALIWKECELVGVATGAALSTMGKHLCADDPQALEAAATALLPSAEETALLQADLTAVVGGTPSARLSSVLNLMADAEGRDTASVWRFSNTSVRRAFDQGRTTDDLLGELNAISNSGVPQPLDYLVRDVARRFAELQVVAVSCCVLGAEALVVEVSRDRALRDLGLTVLAPTVLASRKPVDKTLDRLRAAGYMPVKQTADGTVRLQATGPTTQEQAPLSPVPIRRAEHISGADLEKLAETLLAQPIGSPEDSTYDESALTAPELAFARRTDRLSQGEIRLLAHAMDNGHAVQIDYVDQNGKRTLRTITPYQVHHHWVESYCHLRNGERDFRIDRIRSASATA